jgi:hypothetical protein
MMTAPVPETDSAYGPDREFDHLVVDHLSSDDPRTHWFFRRFADAISSTYRSMDPFVAQLITAPGVLPAEPTIPPEF